MAFGPFGWEAAWLAEVDVQASAVLAHRLGASQPVFPPEFEDDRADKANAKTAAQKLDAWRKAAKRVAWGNRVTNYGDLTRIADLVRAGEAEAPDMLCGGTPCQAFSLAGKREGLRDPRGGLTLSFVELADAIDEARAARGAPPCVVFWENVYGVLTSKDNAFGCFLAALAGEDLPIEPPGGKWSNAGVVLGPQRAVAWRLGDAQYFGVPQRRRRLYVVASARDGFDPAGVLFEREGVRRDSAPRREAGAAVAGTLDARTSAGGFPGSDGVVTDAGAPTLTCNHEAPIVVHGTQDPIVPVDCAMPLGRNSGQENVLVFDPTQITHPANGSNPKPGDPCHTLPARGHAPVVCISGEVTHTLKAEGFDASEDGTGRGVPIVPTAGAVAVRRLLPIECEALQGFPPNWTDVPFGSGRAADGPRYKQLGNSWAVPHARWICGRLTAHLRDLDARAPQPQEAVIANTAEFGCDLRLLLLAA